MRSNWKIIAKMALHAAAITLYIGFALAVVWALFAVEPGKGYSWPY